MKNIKNSWELKVLEEEYKDLSVWNIKYPVYTDNKEQTLSLVNGEEIDMNGIQLFLDEITYNDQQIISSLEEENKLKDSYNNYAKEFNKYNHELKKYVEGTVSEEAIEKSLESKRNELDKINSKKNRLGGRISKIELSRKEELENEINILENRKTEFLNFKATALENYNKSKEEYDQVQQQRVNYENEQRKYEAYVIKTFEYSFNKMALANIKLEEATEEFIKESDLRIKSYKGDDYREALEHYEFLHNMYNDLHRTICDSETIKNVPELLEIISTKQEQLEDDFENRNIKEIEPKPEEVVEETKKDVEISNNDYNSEFDIPLEETFADSNKEEINETEIKPSIEDNYEMNESNVKLEENNEINKSNVKLEENNEINNNDFIDTNEDINVTNNSVDFIDNYELPEEPTTLESLAKEESKFDNNEFIDTNDDIKTNVVNDSVDFIQDEELFTPVETYTQQQYNTNLYNEDTSFVDTPRTKIR